jgi:hypothetical protein
VPLPPLLSERPAALRLSLTVLTPAIAGFLTGVTLGVGIGAWVIANVLAGLGGLGAGFEHDGVRSGVRRGAIGGACFGLALVLADATVVGDRVATIADPAILQTVVTTAGGTLLGALGGAARGRLCRRAAAAATAELESRPRDTCVAVRAAAALLSSCCGRSPSAS